MDYFLDKLNSFLHVFFGFLLIFLLLIPGLSFTQGQYGIIQGKIVNEEGTPIEGVKVTLQSDLYPFLSTVSSKNGEFRFISSSLGMYKVICELSSFKTYIQENIDIRGGIVINLKIVMTPISLKEDVTIAVDSPVVGQGGTGVATHITQRILQEIPSARDTWTILQQVPGIVIDRENVGGTLSGTQSAFSSKGSSISDHQWNMDGVPITDMSHVGFSPVHYDFDSFEEIQVITGGQDVSVQTGGISINFITRRGTNKFRALGYAYFTNDDLQFDNRNEEIKGLGYVGNEINQIMDYGLQVGGPVLKNRIWFWLGYGIQNIKLRSIDGYPDYSKLEGINAKLNIHINKYYKTSLTFIYFNKLGKGKEAGPHRPPETTLDQSNEAFPCLKLENELVFSDRFLFSLKLAVRHDEFRSLPRGGMNIQPGYDIATGVFSGSSSLYSTVRPSYSAGLDGYSYIGNLFGWSSELRFGGEYRLASIGTNAANAGDVMKYYWNGAPYAADIMRESVTDTEVKRFSLYINGLISYGRWALSFGLRADREESMIKETSVEAGRVAPAFMPAMRFPSFNPGVVFLTFSPRIGITYDMSRNGKTLFHINLARYASPMSDEFADFVSPAKSAWARFFWKDLNIDDLVSSDELIGYPTNLILAFDGFDPWNPSQIEFTNFVDKNLRPPLTDELIVGMEREILADFSLRANFVFRRNHRFYWEVFYDKENQKKITHTDYVGPILSALEYGGRIYTYEYWTLGQYRPSGQLIENRINYHQIYTALEVSAVKRFNRRWMMNFSFTYQIHNKYYGDNGFLDPTNLDKLEGTRVAPDHMSSDWMAKLSFLYQLPWGLNVSCFAHARQGYIRPEQLLVKTPEKQIVGLGATTLIYTDYYGEKRLPDFYNMDISLVKDIHFGIFGKISISIDVFNVFNFSHILKRFNQINSARYYEVEKILDPRVLRFGIRYRF